ncbi:MAG: glycosyltransferase family 1 protein [Parcubacteria group bacterium]|jgi:glycosyltransferase involved in cell wall biosynthesis
MRIGIDARFYGSIGKGLGRYTQKLIENLEKIDTQNDYFVFLRKENFAEYQPANNNFQKVLADYRWYTFAEQISMPELLKEYKLDLVHFPHFNVPIFYRKDFVVTIHDLILIHFPTLRGTTLNPVMYWLKFAAYKLAIGSAIRRAKKIIAVSDFTRQDILNHYRVDPQKIVRTYEACDDFCNISDSDEPAIMRKYGLPVDNCGIIKPYLLYVGNPYPHKNLERLIRSFKQLQAADKDLFLALVGKDDYFYQRLQCLVKAEAVKNVIFLGYVPDRDLDIIYKKAKLYVFPSLYEGFGIPPLEAMAKGVPVASSDHPCMMEVLEDSACYFDARNVEKIAQAISQLLGDEKLQQELIEKGYKQIQKYSWKKMALETLEIYNGLFDAKQK